MLFLPVLRLKAMLLVVAAVMPTIVTSTTITAAHEFIVGSFKRTGNTMFSLSPVETRVRNAALMSAAAQHVVHSMKSESFLRELCQRKKTSHVTFYPRCPMLTPIMAATPSQRRDNHPHQAAPRTSLNGSLFHDSFACEYIGKLSWFGLRGNIDGGIKFRETVNVSHCHPSTVLCTTEYYNGVKWVECAVVTCHLSFLATSDHDSINSVLLIRGSPTSIRLDTSSEILIPIPMMPSPIKTALNKMIVSTFDAAAKAFISNFHTTT